MGASTCVSLALSGVILVVSWMCVLLMVSGQYVRTCVGEWSFGASPNIFCWARMTRSVGGVKVRLVTLYLARSVFRDDMRSCDYL